MQIRELMSKSVVSITPEESAALAARLLTRHNLGMLPVCGQDGRLVGVVTDRDIVTRCLASGHSPESTAVREVMTASVVCARADMDTTEAAGMMGREQIRRLPVVEGGKLCGMVSLGDLATFRDTTREASQALSQISSHLSSR